MKRVLGILVCSVLLLGITGCGSKSSNGGNYNKEFENEINIARSMTMPFTATESYSVGELLDNALEDEYWDHFTGYMSNGERYVLVSVKGKSKFDDKEYEIVYEVDTENKSAKLDKTYVDGKEGSGVTGMYRDSYKDIKGE